MPSSASELQQGRETTRSSEGQAEGQEDQSNLPTPTLAQPATLGPLGPRVTPATALPCVNAYPLSFELWYRSLRQHSVGHSHVVTFDTIVQPALVCLCSAQNMYLG